MNNYARFTAAFKDDFLENEVGDIVQPGGRGLLTAVASKVAFAEPVYQPSHYGWEFKFRCPSGLRARALLQWADPWLLIVVAETGWFVSRSKRVAAYAEAVFVIDTALAGCEGISNVVWMNADEFENRSILHG